VKDPGFMDMKPGTYGYEMVAKAVELGIIHGKTNAQGQKFFDPYGKLTRAQMASILANAYQLKGTTDVAFSDVPKSHWAYEAVKALANNGITVGYGNGTFGTNDPITRTQYAVMMARLLNDEFKQTQTTNPSNNTDGSNSSKGQTYPDGWAAPVLKSSVKSDFKENLNILKNELGFTKLNGQLYVNEENYEVMGYLGSDTYAEHLLEFNFWDNSDFKDAYRIPIVAKEFLKLFFEDDYMIPFNYLNDYFHNGVVPPETFTANGKTVETIEGKSNIIFAIQK